MTTDVLFILGAGRSGSTVLERYLSEAGGGFPVGEMRFVWRRGFEENHLCSCGEPFLSCQTWRRIRLQAFPGAGMPEPVAVTELTTRVDRNRFIPAMHLKSFRSVAMSGRMERTRGFLERWYRSIAEMTGGRLIIDSSKDPSYAHLLSTVPGLRITYLHLIRDSRAVAYSHRRAKRRPEIHWKDELMEVWSPRRSALDWDIKCALGGLLGVVKPGSVMTVRYEAFVSDPPGTLQRVNEVLHARGMRQLGGNANDAAGYAYHTVSGNPIRFDAAPLRIRLDNEWRSAMSRSERALVSVLTGPFLARHRAAVRSSASDDRTEPRTNVPAASSSSSR